MDTLVQYYRKTELFFGNVKFAVVIITIFAIALGFGTFMESYHGTDYANRLVYKSIPFMFVQFLMFLSIVFATLIRLPAKKHLYGFYVIHAGLIILFLGSFVTYKAGVDGTITLSPNLPNREILVNEDEFKIQFPSRGKEVTVDLPYTAFKKDLRLDYEGIQLGAFLPFAEDELHWIPMQQKDAAQTSARYRIYNDNFGDFVTMSLHSQSDFSNTTQMGLLNVHYMPGSLGECFAQNTEDGLIVWNGETGGCVAPQKKDIIRKKSITGKNLAIIDFQGQKISFMPDLSPMPLDEKMDLNQASPFRVFSRKLFEKSPHLFLFGKRIAFFDKEKAQWISESFDNKEELDLPWMGFRLRLVEYHDDKYPSMVPSFVKPVQDNGQTIKGGIRAIQVKIKDHEFWVKSDEPVNFNHDGEKITFILGKKAITLPYELVLDQFKMDTDPGTQNPASFESYVTLFKGDQGSTRHHIFMNNPLKHENFTFYQASYFQTQQGPFGSVLSVNFDPGRFWKYLGSFLLVFGSAWHYFLRRKHLKKPGAQNA